MVNLLLLEKVKLLIVFGLQEFDGIIQAELVNCKILPFESIILFVFDWFTN